MGSGVAGAEAGGDFLDFVIGRVRDQLWGQAGVNRVR